MFGSHQPRRDRIGSHAFVVILVSAVHGGHDALLGTSNTDVTAPSPYERNDIGHTQTGALAHVVASRGSFRAATPKNEE